MTYFHFNPLQLYIKLLQNSNTSGNDCLPSFLLFSQNLWIISIQGSLSVIFEFLKKGSKKTYAKYPHIKYSYYISHYQHTALIKNDGKRRIYISYFRRHDLKGGDLLR